MIGMRQRRELHDKRHYSIEKQVRLAAKRAHVMRMRRARGLATHSQIEAWRLTLGARCMTVCFTRCPSARPEGRAPFRPRRDRGKG